MRPIATGRVVWSFGLSVTTISPAKTAKPTDMPFGMWTWVGPRNYVLDGSPDPPMGTDTFEGIMSQFSCTLPSTIPSGPDVGISPHAVNQRSY